MARTTRRRALRATQLLLGGAGAVALGVGLAGCADPSQQSRNEATDPGSSATGPSPTGAPPSPSGAPPVSSDSAAAYADGQYEATGWYGSLPSHHDVTLTIENDTVIDVAITTPAEDETSLGYQQRFVDALPAEIIGRNIDEIAVDRLAGSSGCSEGFMDALTQIKEQARQ